MLSLHLLGGLALANSEGLVPSRAQQRRRLALLAILAVARARPVSRDKLVALLWPESDTERARHLLADSIYVIRDALGEDVLITMGDDLSLNPERVACDTIEFERALDTGDRAGAARVYGAGGAFLDGVHLTDAPEFERWAESVRSRLAEAYRGALSQLAADATSRADHAAAVEWWRRLAAEDRLSSRAALGLMRALAASGDRGGALEFARVHESTVRAELEAAPDPAITAFVEELRAGGSTPAVSRAAEAPERVAPASSATPVAVEKAPPAAPEKTPGKTARVRTMRLAVAVLTLAAGAYGTLRLARYAVSTSRGAPSAIAVLPLAVLDQSPESEAFADGMTSELIDALTTVAGLRVISGTSAFAFKGHHTDVRRIADSLHASHVVEGDIERTASKIRMHLRLVDAADGSTRWSGTFSRDITDAWTVQGQVARAVAGEFGMRLASGAAAHLPEHGTRNPAAYDLYVRGRSQRELRSDTGMKAAMQFFGEAIALDSTFAAAWAGRAEAASVLGTVANTADYPRVQVTTQARAAALKAVALDDSLPDAHVALGFSYMNGEINLRTAETEMRRALALNPEHRRAREYLAVLDVWFGRPDEALREARRAADLDPLSVTALREIARALFLMHRYDDALAELDRARSMGPPLRAANNLSGEIYANMRRYPEAIARLGKGGGLLARALLGHTLARSGNRVEATRIVRELEARWQAGTGGAYYVAVVYAGLSDFTQAFAWLDKSFEDRSTHFTLAHPTFEDLRADPRFARIRVKLGLQNP